MTCSCSRVIMPQLHRCSSREIYALIGIESTGGCGLKRFLAGMMVFAGIGKKPQLRARYKFTGYENQFFTACQMPFFILRLSTVAASSLIGASAETSDAPK